MPSLSALGSHKSIFCLYRCTRSRHLDISCKWSLILRWSFQLHFSYYKCSVFRTTHVGAQINPSFLFTAESYSVPCIYNIVSNHLALDSLTSVGLLWTTPERLLILSVKRIICHVAFEDLHIWKARVGHLGNRGCLEEPSDFWVTKIEELRTLEEAGGQLQEA